MKISHLADPNLARARRLTKKSRLIRLERLV